MAAATKTGAAPKAAEAGSAAGGAAREEVPDQVRSFLLALHKRLRQRNRHEIQSLYLTDFPRLADRFYSKTHWPHVETISELVDKDENFEVLYKELYYRHIYYKLANRLTIEDRYDSFQNYIDLFNIILGLKPDAPEFELPNIWLFEMMEEFVFQFQSFHAYRSHTKDLSEAEIKFLREEDPHTWSAPTILRYLTALIKKGGMHSSTAAPSAGDKKEPVVHAFFKSMAQFAIIALCRVNCLLGDYATALKVLDPIDLISKRSTFAEVGGAYVSLYYYLTLSYMMTGRYTDAIKASSGLLLWASRNAHDTSVSGIPRSAGKRIEQVYGLLAISQALSPQRLSDQLSTPLRERFGDKLQRMAKCDVAAFEEVFLNSCPKYVDPATPTVLLPGSTAAIPSASTPSAGAGAAAKKSEKKAADEKSAATKPEKSGGDHKGASEHSKDVKKEAANARSDEDVMTRTQLRVLLRDVRQRASLPDTISYLKLCTSITVSKLALFLKADKTETESATASGILNLKNKTRSLRWRGGPPASGVMASTAELDVAISKDVVLIAEYKAARRYGEYFIRQILQLSRLSDDITSIQTA